MDRLCHHNQTAACELTFQMPTMAVSIRMFKHFTVEANQMSAQKTPDISTSQCLFVPVRRRSNWSSRKDLSDSGEYPRYNPTSPHPDFVPPGEHQGVTGKLTFMFDKCSQTSFRTTALIVLEKIVPAAFLGTNERRRRDVQQMRTMHPSKTRFLSQLKFTTTSATSLSVESWLVTS